MKLYATATSERASKGQGGNNFIDIAVRDDSEAIIALMSFYPDHTARISFREDIQTDIDHPNEIELTNREAQRPKRQ